MFVENIYQYTI